MIGFRHVTGVTDWTLKYMPDSQGHYLSAIEIYQMADSQTTGQYFVPVHRRSSHEVFNSRMRQSDSTVALDHGRDGPNGRTGRHFWCTPFLRVDNQVPMFSTNLSSWETPWSGMRFIDDAP